MARKSKRWSEKSIVLAFGGVFLGILALVVFFGADNTGAANYERWVEVGPNFPSGIEAQYEQYRSIGNTIAGECLRNAKNQAINRCCDMLDIPNSPVSCTDLCEPFGWDERTCFRICQEQCKKTVANALSPARGTLGY